MTTIAFDGKTIATDSMISMPYASYGKKYEIIGDQVILGAGSATDIEVWKQWFCGEEELNFSNHTDVDFVVFVFCLKTGNLDMYCWSNPHVPMYKNAKGLHATGSGGDIALGAMAAGKTAAEAVKIASKYDPNTGGKIYTFSKR